ncbi:MAG: tetraacyldisaccharide 4'-kinase, partial [Bdellovibrionales bacterium]
MKWLKKIASQVYSQGTALHRYLYQKGFLVVHQYPTPIMSVGNLTLGGTGKTPLTLFLVQELNQAGVECAVVCKSYNADLEEAQELPLHPDPQLYGDEACLIKGVHPHIKVVSGPKKWENAKLAAFDRKIQMILLDDGFQHHALFQNWRGLVFDLSQDFENFIWRDSFEQIKNADALFLNRSTESQRQEFTKSLLNQGVQKPVFEMRLESMKIHSSITSE